jgi:8-oxo-dGTP pyrophosphatase MutT (NUDIX family)
MHEVHGREFDYFFQPERAKRWAVDPDFPVVKPRDAATVTLIRDTPNGIEVFVLRRDAGMAFMPQATVFPGGTIDPRDGAPLPWAGPSPAAWADLMDTDETMARRILAAAIRELYEETGVLLAGPDDHSLVDWPVGQDPTRHALAAREVSLTEVLTDWNLVLRTDLLTFRCRWVTDPWADRRYNVRFFCAGLPHGQVADGATSEAEQSGWVNPQWPLDEAAAGRQEVSPPTQVQLELLLAAGSVAAASKQMLLPKPVMLYARQRPDGTWCSYTGEADC